MTAGIDLMLALVEDDLGVEMVAWLQRKWSCTTGARAGVQFSALLELEPKSIASSALVHTRQSARPAVVEDLAEVAI
jgi:transcriptional regulator GlxA family with amidase domain